MKALSFKRLMPLFAFFIMFAGARAADYLWEPKLMWESKTYNQSVWPYFFNNDENIIFSTGGQLVVLDSKTGKEVKKSEKINQSIASLTFTKDEKILYAISDNIDIKCATILSFDMESMELIDSIPFPYYEFSAFSPNGEPLRLRGADAIIPISENKILLMMNGDRIGSQGRISCVTLIAIDPNKKISWDKPEEIKIEYYLDNYNGDPLISSDYKYLFHGSTVWDLVNMKEYWQIPNGVFANITRDAKHIYVYDSDSSSIYNLQTKELLYKADSKLIYGAFSTNVKFLINDPSKIFYNVAGDPYFDFKDDKVKYAIDPKYKIGGEFYNSKNTMFIGRGINNIIAHSINPISSVDTPDINTEALKYESSKLLIPNKDKKIKEIIIYNSDGKLINEFSKFDSNDTYAYLDINSLNLGVYFVTVINTDGSKMNYKFMKGE